MAPHCGSSSVYHLRLTHWGRHFVEDAFKRIFSNENVRISIKISLKFIPKSPVNNIPALVQIRASRQTGDRPLSKPMMVRLPMHICITWPQWVNTLMPYWNINLCHHLFSNALLSVWYEDLSQCWLVLNGNKLLSFFYQNKHFSFK